MERRNRTPPPISTQINEGQPGRDLSSLQRVDSAKQIMRSVPNARKKLLQQPTTQRKNAVRLRNAFLAFARDPFQILKENMFEQRKKSILQRLGVLVQSKKPQYLKVGLVMVHGKLLSFRNACKMSVRLNRLFKFQIRNRYQVGYRKIVQKSYWRSRRIILTKIMNSPAVLNRCFEKIKIRKYREVWSKLRCNALIYDNQLKGVGRLSNQLKRYLRLVKAMSFSRIISYSVLIETKRKHRRFVKTGLPELTQQNEQQRLLEVKQLKKQLQNQINRTSELQNQIKVLKSAETQYHPVSHNSRYRPPAPGSEYSQDQNSRANSLNSSHGRSVKSIYSSDISQSKSFYSVNTKSLLNKLETMNLPVDTSTHNCKYRKKYVQINSKNQQLQRMLELKDDECRMLEGINKHIEETIEKELGRVDQVGEIGELTRRVKDLESELSKTQQEFEQIKKQKEQQKRKFKKKLEGILEKVMKSKKP